MVTAMVAMETQSVTMVVTKNGDPNATGIHNQLGLLIFVCYRAIGLPLTVAL